MQMIINYFTQNTGKGFLASALSSIFGFGVGYMELIKWIIIFLQITSFSVAIFVGVLSAISWFEKRKKK